ncbi:MULTISPECIES: hypothetical protein [Shewanella]|uniref:Uncharacterized protein n=1 Tax=Shewanella fidelis TaxID=173509 RepID=A0AAW8NK28_9GAMM|nr:MULTISPECIES: hypothetical protein [Shewanella]MDR8522243.1 hypothetical protein [Shewanella fidelis]MDW4812541.1 hypothetical protein [Shewanella fidelis]MDW4816288.1 hypothetical protein [Shewanella fidelis]MDW4820782.1 hypothetical protein [Shewanella fidelis]MDW4825004.1 hypothetical protein [Shewanella fidelis]
MNTVNSNSSRRKPLIAFAVVASIVALFVALVMVMPKGFKSTHEEIGTGKPAIVFVYDNGLAMSNSQTEQMNEARDYLGDSVYFLIATTGTPEGDKLIRQHRADSAELLLFDASGKLTKRQYGLKTAGELVMWVE